MIYVLLSILVVAEIITGIEVVKSVNRFCDSNRQRLDEGTDVSDSDLLSDVRCGISSRSSNQSTIDREEALTVLDTLSVGASTKEKAAIDYAKECIDIAHKLAKNFKGETE